MANMSYCRFENTLRALEDCFDNFDGNDLSRSEKIARENLYILCRDIVQSYDLDEVKTDKD